MFRILCQEWSQLSQDNETEVACPYNYADMMMQSTARVNEKA